MTGVTVTVQRRHQRRGERGAIAIMRQRCASVAAPRRRFGGGLAITVVVPCVPGEGGLG